MDHTYERFHKEIGTNVKESYLDALLHFYVSGYYLDLVSETYIAIGQKQEYNERYHTEDDWARMDDYIRDCIHKDDQARMREVSRIPYIRERLKKERSYSIEVRDHGTGEERWYRYTTMRGADEDHAAICFLDVTEQVLQRQERERLETSLEEQNRQLEENQAQLEEASTEQEAQIEEINALNSELTEQKDNLEQHYDAVRSLSKVYYASYYVDIDEDEYYELFSNDEIKDKYAAFGPKGKSQAVLNWVCENRIAPEYRDQARAFMDYSTLSERMKDTEIVSLRVQLVTGDWSRIRFIAGARHEDGTLKSCVYVVRNINQEVSEEKRRSSELQQALELAQDAQAEQEAQLEEITALNGELEENRAQLEQALDAEEEAAGMLDRVHEVLGTAPWRIEYDEIGRESKVALSDGLRRLYGYENKEDFPDSIEFLNDRIHPADRERVLREVYGTLAGADSAEVNVTSRYRAIRKDGTIRWFRIQGIITRREDGTPQTAYGVVQDITNIEAASIAQQEAMEAMSAVHEALGSANWRMDFDAEGNMTACIWSDRFRKMVGFETVEEFPNELSSWTDRLHPADKKSVLKIYWDAVLDRKGKSAYNVEYRMLTRLRGYRWFRATGSVTRRGDGTPKVFYGLFLDINDEVLSAQSQETAMREITELNHQLEENQAKLEEAASEQEAQLEEITALNDELQEKQAKLEEVSSEQEAQLDEIKQLYGMVETFSREYHTIWLVDKETLRMRLIRSSGISTVKAAVSMAKELVELDPTVKKYCAAFVEPQDRERAEREMSSAEVLQHLKDHPDEIYAVNYLRRDESGNVGYHQIAFANMESGDGRERFLLGFRNIDSIVREEQKRAEELQSALTLAEEAQAEQKAQIEEINSLNGELQEKQAKLEEVSAEQEAQIDEIKQLYGMIRGLSQDYHTIWLVDKETSRMRLIRSSGVSTIQNAVQMGKDMPEFDKGFNAYIETYVEPEDRERMHREIAFSEILRQLSENPTKLYAVNYLRRTDDGKVGYHQIAFANADTDDGKKQFVYGFRDVDEMVREERRRNETLEKALHRAQEASAEQEAQLEEITALNSELHENQIKLEKAAAEQKAQLEEIREYDAALANAGYGMWRIILKDGAAPRMQVNAKMAELLGVVGESLTEEEMYTAWYGRIVPDAIPSVQASVGEMLAGKFSENTYQWSHPKKGVIYVRCGGTAEKLEDGTNLLSGYHADVTDIVLQQKQQEETLKAANDRLTESAREMESSLRITRALSRDYSYVFLINAESGTSRAITVTKEVSTLLGIKGSEEHFYADTIGRYLASDRIYEEDRPALTDAWRLEHVRAELKNRDEYIGSYRTMENGELHYYQYKFRVVPKTGFILLGFMNIDDQIMGEVEKNRVLEKANARIEAERARVAEAYGLIRGLSQDYHTIWVVDKETSRMRLIRSSGVSTIQNAVQMGKDMPEFDKGFDAYIETYVEPEDRERMHREIAFSEILRQLEENPTKLYAVNYLRRTDDGKVGYHQIAFANADTEDGRKQFVYGFRDVDEMVREEQKRTEELQNALTLAEEAQAEQEAQLEEIHSLNNELQSNQAELEAAVAEQQTQIEEINELNRSLADHDAIMANAGYGMWHIILKDGVAPRMQANAKMRELLGAADKELTEEEMYNAWYDQIVPEAIPSVQASVGEMLAGKFSENTYQWVHPTKGTIYVRCGGTAKQMEDGSTVIGGYHSDVTAIVSAEKQHEKTLERAKQAAETADRAKTRFLFNMSHDIRTPMNAIIGYANLMKRSGANMEKWPDYLDKILDSSGFLLDLINNVLEMARIESGKTVLDADIVDLKDLAGSIYAVFEGQMKKKDLQFTSSLDIDHEFVQGDATKLREIFLNLVSNAYKYTPAGGSVYMGLKELPSDRAGYAVMQAVVRDNGIGMSADFLPHLFEEFTRERTTTENKVQGTGLGMPIVKKLVDLMGGTIDVESELGKGTTFTVTFNAKLMGGTAKQADEDASADADLTGRRILLAEDNDLNAEIAEELLGETGAEVERAADGVIAVNMLLEAAEGYYDLILMDIQMPNMNGYQATQTIRKLPDPLKASIPIIAMTANAFDEDKKNALAAGMDGHVAKPIDIPKLMKTISRILKKRDQTLLEDDGRYTADDMEAQENRIYLELKKSFASSVAPGGFFAYRAEQPEKLIYANETACAIWGCSSFEELSAFAGGCFRGLIHPDDYERVEQEIWQQINGGPSGLDQVKYRIVKRDGTVANIDDYGRLVRDPEHGDIFYVFVSESPNAQ